MGVRPPTGDSADGPEAVDFGIAALDARLDSREISFPVTAADLTEGHGEVEIAVDSSGTTVTLARALERTDREQFDTRQALLNALHPVFEAERSRSGGVVGRLRDLVPF